MSIVHDAAHACLMESDPARKAACVRRLQQDFAAGLLGVGQGGTAQPVPDPGRPARPELVDRRQLA
ncbi:MAG TPA: DUF455 domain-containing protein, partial [Chromatiales bacterium]|nr:DUF455 domain-containing protein [Chromatiales bacterium]